MKSPRLFRNLVLGSALIVTMTGCKRMAELQQIGDEKREIVDRQAKIDGEYCWSSRAISDGEGKHYGVDFGCDGRFEGLANRDPRYIVAIDSTYANNQEFILTVNAQTLLGGTELTDRITRLMASTDSIYRMRYDDIRR